MEIASYLIDKASSITVIGSSEMPYQNTLGPEIGRVTMMVRQRETERVTLQNEFFTSLLLQMLAERNVKFYMNDSVTEVRGQDGKVKEVVLKSGKVLPADVFIVGIGEFTITFSFLVFLNSLFPAKSTVWRFSPFTSNSSTEK